MRKFLGAVRFLSVALSLIGNGWGAAIDCCCDLECTFHVPFVGLVKETYNGCQTFEDEMFLMCNEEIICRTQFLHYALFYKSYTGQCDFKNLDDDCESESLLGADHPGLDILRQFRDEELSKSDNGRKLINVYYTYGDVLIKAFEENPAIEVFAAEILEKTIERLYTALGSEDKLLTNEIATDIEILIDELNMVVANPGLKKTLKQIKRDMKKGTLF